MNKKDLLCCLVNKAGECAHCKRVKCSDHSFECTGCMTTCHDCRTEDKCSRCASPTCTRCLMNSFSSKGICPLCYTDDTHPSDDGDSFQYNGLIEPYDYDNDR